MAAPTSRTAQVTADPPPAAARRTPGQVTTVVLVYVVLLALGVLLGLLGSFLVPLRAGQTRVPVSVAIAAVGNATAVLLGDRATGSWRGAAVPALAWLVVVVLLGSARPEGDIIVTGDAVGLAYVFTGMLSSALAIGLAPSLRSRLGRR